MDLSNRNDRPCSGCRHAEPSEAYGDWLVCAHPAVVYELRGKRHCGEIARHREPCGPDGSKWEKKR
jgi:hypothetical protein